jgi:GGDEF domain-containing protein
LGGDEFAILMEHCGLFQANQAAEHVIHALFGLCVTTKESFSIFSLAALSRVISCANPSTAITFPYFAGR